MEVILFWDVVLNDVEFVDNVAESYGGAIYGFVGRGDSTTDNRFNNVTFARNSAAEGAAIFNEYENVSLNVTNAVFWSNTGSATSSVYTVEGSNTSLQYSCFEEAEAQAGEGNLVMAPDSLAVIDLDGDGFEELLLTSGSPCIDAGSDTLAGDAGLATSQSAQWWYIRSTSDDCLPDLNTVDMGRHHALDICEVPLP